MASIERKRFLTFGAWTALSFAIATNAFAVPLSELQALLCRSSTVESAVSKAQWTSFFKRLGPTLSLRPVKTLYRVPIAKAFPKKPDALRIATYNVESESYMPVSNATKLENLARQMNAIDADVWMIEEIGSEAELELLAQNLEGEFQIAFAPGNDRHRHLGVIARRQPGLRFVLQSHRQVETANQGEFVFNRDLPVLIAADANDRPLWMIFGTHYKSRRGSDDNGTGVRRLQVESSIALMRAYRQWAGERTPVFIAGDFNDDLSEADDFEAFWNSGWRNPLEGQTTHFWAKRKKGRVDPAAETQLDGILVHSGDSVRVLQSGVLENPFTLASRSDDAEERKRFHLRPSDHLPLFVDIGL